MAATYHSSLTSPTAAAALKGAVPRDPSPSYVHSRVTVYHASKIDLRYCRSLHSCATCGLGRVDVPCGAIHYGHCKGVLMPSGRHPKRHASSSLPASPSSPAGTSRSSAERPSSIVFRRSISLPGNSSGLTSPLAATAPRSPNRTNVGFPRAGEGVGRSRSLAILREGHELAPPSPDRPGPLMRLYPQRQVVFQGPSIRIGTKPRDSDLPSSPGPRSPVGGAQHNAMPPGDGGPVSPSPGSPGGRGGVAITIQHGQTNITSGDGSTDIKIQGQGHEIHIQGSGGQNIRVQPAMRAGGQAGHVIRIQGQPHASLRYRQGLVTPYERTAMIGPIAPPADFIDAAPSSPSTTSTSSPSPSSSLPASPAPGSFTSTKQIPAQKPTARVAPAPIAVPIPVQTPSSASSPAPSSSPTCSSPTPSSQATPPFPVSPMSTSTNATPSSSPPPSPPAAPSSPVAMVTPTKVTEPQPSIAANHKDTNHLSPANVAPNSTTIHPDGGLQKPHPDDGGVKGSGSHPAHHANEDSTNVSPSLPHQQQAIENNQRNQKEKEQPATRHHHHHHHPHPNNLSQNSQQQSATDAKVPGVPSRPGTEESGRPRKKANNNSSSKAALIPQFYFPLGKPNTQSGQLESALQAVSKQFGSLEGGKAYKQQMGDITKASGLPLYWKILLFRAAGGANDGHITFSSLSSVLKKLYQTCYDEASRFMRLAGKQGATFLEFDDFEPLIQDVVETHPGLTFLQDAPEFHSRYVTTVASRVMFCVNRSWTGRITLSELRKSNFLETVALLETEEDINQVKDFFSYEHFYVIYCKFWELDKDHDLYIDKNDLSRHNDHALNSRLVDRIFSGAVTRGADFREGRMTYGEFVWFLLAEEDKKHPTSVEYWFRCMDLDGDGVISMYEMEYFHEEQMNKMEALGIERLPFEDTVCQMMDLVRPRAEGQITLRDLKNCKMTNIFFDTFFNLDKFLEHEQRDPFANARDPNAEHVDVSDWNRFAEEEYDILVQDEGSGDMEEGHYEDDFEPEDEDEILREQMLRLTDSNQSSALQKLSPGTSHTTDDIYDFSNTGNLGY